MDQEEELVAAETLLELWKPVVRWGFPYSWGCKRRRSAEEAQPSFLRWLACADQIEEEEEEEASSPATPLSVAVVVAVARKEESRKITLTHYTTNEEIRKTEVKNAKHLRKLESNNFLKARKLEIINGTVKIKQKSEDILSQKHSVKPNPIIDDSDLIPREPCNEDNRTVPETEILSSCTTYQLSTNEKVVPRIDVDLNAQPPVESFPTHCWDGSNLCLFDQVNFRRAMAVQARRRRILICRTKKNK